MGALAQSGDGPCRAGLHPGRAAAPVRHRRRAARGGARASGASWSPTPACWSCWPTCRRTGEIPASVVWKVSAMLAPANPLTVAQLERLGASTVNVPVRRHAGPARRDARGDHLPIDLYVEAPSGDGRRGPRAGGGRPGGRGRADVRRSSGCATRGRSTPAACTWRARRPRSRGRRCTAPRVALEWMAPQRAGPGPVAARRAGPRRPGAIDMTKRGTGPALSAARRLRSAAWPAQRRLADRRRRGRDAAPGRAAPRPA